jgi:adenylate cyclase
MGDLAVTPNIAFEYSEPTSISIRPTAEERLRASFASVSRSRAFRRAKRLVELLRFAVDAAVNGTTLDQPKIAEAVFGKREEFDCSTDPVVRVQFSRLRLRLDEYYAQEGAADAFRLVVSPRGYQVRIEENRPAGAQTFTLPADRASESQPEGGRLLGDYPPKNPCSIVVLPFVNLTNNAENDVFCHGLTDELISALTPWDGVDVLSRGSSFQFGGAQMDVRELGRELDVSMVLEGSVRMEDDRTRATVQLCSTETGFTLWSQSFDRETGTHLEVEAGVSAEIVQQLKAVLPRLGSCGSTEDSGIAEQEDAELQTT